MIDEKDKAHSYLMSTSMNLALLMWMKYAAIGQLDDVSLQYFASFPSRTKACRALLFWLKASKAPSGL